MKAIGLRLITLILVGLFIGASGGFVQDTPTVRVGLEAVGTFSWLNFAMEHYGIDQELGFQLETTTYATKQAKQLALQAGDSDVVVDDFVGVLLWREQGLPVRAVYPYSLATGGVVVRSDSDIQTLEDLRGRTIAATDLGDKSLLILRALTTSQYGFDSQVDGEVVAAAPPLMSELLTRGEIDAAIPPWHFVARMTGGGDFREIASAVDMLEALGVSSDLPILVIAARDDMDSDLLRRYLEGLEQTIERMQSDPEVFDLILEKELYSLPDPSVFPAVIERWEAGIPTVWNQEVIDGLVALTENLIDLAGSEVVGVSEADPSAFTLEVAP